MKKAMSIYRDKVNNAIEKDPESVTINISYSDLEKELHEFVKILIQFPRTKSYNLEEIQFALNSNEFSQINRSKLLLLFALESLEEVNLLPGVFISSIGVLDLISDLSVESLSSAFVDQNACGGLSSIEKPSIFLNHVYQYNTCPFCKKIVTVSDIKIFAVAEVLKAGISLVPLKLNSKAAFHIKI